MSCDKSIQTPQLNGIINTVTSSIGLLHYMNTCRPNHVTCVETPQDRLNHPNLRRIVLLRCYLDLIFAQKSLYSEVGNLSFIPKFNKSKNLTGNEAYFDCSLIIFYICWSSHEFLYSYSPKRSLNILHMCCVSFFDRHSCPYPPMAFNRLK